MHLRLFWSLQVRTRFKVLVLALFLAFWMWILLMESYRFVLDYDTHGVPFDY